MHALILAALIAGGPTKPPQSFAPVLHVRVIAPNGVNITLRPYTSDSRSYPGAADFGVRPGYIAWMALNGIPNDPNLVLYPSLEVRASLFMPANLKGSDYPAVVRITEDDLLRVSTGGMVTKVIYLENPEVAIAEATTPNMPIERDAVRGDDPVELAERRGRVLGILRLGNRSMNHDELLRCDVAGVVQQKGETLGPPSRPPMLCARTFQLFDPASGPRIPTEELVPNGGDIGPRIGIGQDGHIGNLDPTDAGVEFRYNGYARRTTVSNRPCLFAPRILVIRQDITPAGIDSQLIPLGAISTTGLVAFRTRQPALDVAEATPPLATIGHLMLKGAESREGVRILDNMQGLLGLARVDVVTVKAAIVEPATLIQYRDHCKPNEPLVLVKTASPEEARPGDIVTITLKFINYGSQAARELAISDNLSPRLEYVEGSSKGDRPTVFTMQDAGKGSTILRWEVAGEVPAGQSGVVQFQVRVR